VKKTLRDFIGKQREVFSTFLSSRYLFLLERSCLAVLVAQLPFTKQYFSFCNRQLIRLHLSIKQVMQLEVQSGALNGQKVSQYYKGVCFSQSSTAEHKLA
jgi:hypothetical protein